MKALSYIQSLKNCGLFVDYFINVGYRRYRDAMFFRLSHEVNSKDMCVMVRVKYVEMQISLSETHEGVKTKNKADMEGSKYLAQIAFLLLVNNSKRSKILQI